MKRHFAYGQRVWQSRRKYEQRFCNSGWRSETCGAAEVALVTTPLLLRGAQTPGELRSRASRIYEFSDMGSLNPRWNGLPAVRTAVCRPLAREPGKRESRYMHLLRRRR